MAFIQIVELDTENYDAIGALEAEWEAGTKGRTTAQRSIVCRDRQNPSRHLVIVFFDSYEAAMKNSELPETSEFAERMADLVTGQPSFHDLDVLEDRTLT
jgi:hypothetical protein